MKDAIRDPQDTPQYEAMYTLPIEASGVSGLGELVEDTAADHFHMAFEGAARNGGLTGCYLVRYSSENLKRLDEDVAAMLYQEMERRGSNEIEVVVIPRN